MGCEILRMRSRLTSASCESREGASRHFTERSPLGIRSEPDNQLSWRVFTLADCPPSHLLLLGSSPCGHREISIGNCLVGWLWTMVNTMVPRQQKSESYPLHRFFSLAVPL